MSNEGGTSTLTVTVVKVVFPRAVFLLHGGRSRPIILRFLGPASASIGKNRAGQFRILGTIVPAVPFPPSSRWVVYGSVLRFIELLVFLPDLLIMVFGAAGVLGSGAVLLVDLSTQFASSPIVCLVGKSVGSSCLVWRWVLCCLVWCCVGCRGVCWLGTLLGVAALFGGVLVLCWLSWSG
ncbi:hypothetical protein ACOSP7_009654 [Xanthoceras sorbifolium]